MTLSLPRRRLETLEDAQRNFQEIAKAFPVGQENVVGGVEVTSLPASAQHGQIAFYRVAEGIVWQLRYNAASSSAYKWEYVGGPPRRIDAVAAQATSSSTYQTTGTPSVAAPLAGDYDVKFGCDLAQNQAAAINQMEFALHVNGVGFWIGYFIAQNLFEGGGIYSEHRITSVTAGHAINPRYRSQSSQASSFRQMYVCITPQRVSG